MFDGITLVCADGSHNSKESEKKLNYIASKFGFNNYKFFSYGLSSLDKYNDFLINHLHKEIKTDYVLIMQLDGYPFNKAGWTNEFLEYDYIGAPWYTQPWDLSRTVGNGGFSLRSKKFLLESSKLGYKEDCKIPEDVFLCRVANVQLINKGIKFAPHELAYKFSVEDMPYKGQFGFHGKFTIELNKRFGIFL